MGLPSSQIAAGWVKDHLRERHWAPVNEMLTIAVTAKWTGHSEEEISDFVADNVDFVAEHLRDESAQALMDGAVCPFEIDGEDGYIRASSEDDGDLLKKLKIICPFAFEEVCAMLLEKIGANSKVTSKTRDGGVDFIATGLDILPAAMNCPQHCKASVIGQAKRYSSKLIAEKALREFVGASVIHRNDLRVSKSISPLSPVLLAFWTTSNFEPNTKEFARSAGVWLMDGYTLSMYLARLGLTDWVMSMENAAAEGVSSKAPLPPATPH